MSISAARLSICAILMSTLGLGGALAQSSDSTGEPVEVYQRLKSKWDQKQTSPLTADVLKRGVEQFWTLREKYPQSKTARKATLEAFRLLNAGGPIFVEWDSTSVRLMKVKYNQVGLNEPVKAQLLSYVSRFSQAPVDEWRQVAKRSEVSSVQQAALFHLARRHHRRNRYDRAERLLDTLSAQYEMTEAHPRYGEEIKEMRQEIQRFKVGSILPPLRAQALSGDTIDTAETGEAVTLLFFYGSGCGTCIRQYPTLNRLYNEYDRNRVRLIGIPVDPTVDYGMTKSNFRAYMEKYGIEWPQAWEKKKSLPNEYNVGALGTAMLLNREGRLVWLGRDGPIDTSDQLKGQTLPEAVASLVQ